MDEEHTQEEFDEEGDRILDIGELTPLERQEVEEARKLHRLNMTKKQRGFKGEKAFISKPGEIAFRDFTVGKPHYLVITLTNVSNAFNSFNVLPLPEKIRVNIMLSRTTLKFSTPLRARLRQASSVTFALSSSRSSMKISYRNSPFWRKLAKFLTLSFAHPRRPL